MKRSHRRWSEELPFPREVEFVFCDTIESLRPKLKLCEDYASACEQVEALEKELRELLGESHSFAVQFVKVED